MDDFESSQFDNLLPTQAQEKNSSDEPAESSLFKKITSDSNTGGWKLDSSSQVIKNGLLKGYGKNLFDEKKQAVINTNILVAGNVNHDNIEAVKKLGGTKRLPRRFVCTLERTLKSWKQVSSMSRRGGRMRVHGGFPKFLILW